MTSTRAGALTASKMAEAISRFLPDLDSEQRERVAFDFDWDERLDWHYIPKPREGVPRGQMTAEQLAAADALMASGLSQMGYDKAQAIVRHEAILRRVEEREGISQHVRETGRYFFSIFGTPGDDDPWGWRVEGHHLSVNYTVSEGRVVSATPSFFGANPAEVKDGAEKGLRILKDEEDMGRALFLGLDDEQQRSATVFSDAPADIITGADRKVDVGDPTGLPAAAMNGHQRESLMALLRLYVERVPADVAGEALDKIESAGIDQVRFGWAGGAERGQGHYYRVQGPGFLLEYDNTQNGANHIHAVWRDVEGDFGYDALADHYHQHHT